MARILTALLGDDEVAALLDDMATARAMVEVERALARAQATLGVIPVEAGTTIPDRLARFAPDLADLAQGTLASGIPVPALVAQLRRAVGDDAASFVHWGATSQDVVDTALVLQLRGALVVMEERLARLVAALAKLAETHRTTPTVARTRFQQALPTVFGLKVAGWLMPLLRHRDRLQELRPRLLAVQLGGAAGNLAALGENGVAVMEALALELGLSCPPMCWHSQRDTVAELASWLALVTGSLGKFGQDVLLMSQNELGELREAKGGGSSTMPQKSNPILSEALVTLARRNATSLAGLHQAALHAQERDGAAWALEWAILPDMVSGAAAALAHAGELADTMIVDIGRMRETLDGTHGLLLAEAVSFALAQYMPRAEAAEFVKEAACEAQATRADLIEIVAARTSFPIDWTALRSAHERPLGVYLLIDRVLAACSSSH